MTNARKLNIIKNAIKKMLCDNPDSWGSEEQIQAEVYFFDLATSLGWNPENDETFQDYALKATCEEMLDFAMERMRETGTIEMSVCPQCEGAGNVDMEVFVFGQEGGTLHSIKCITCEGDKFIDSETLDAYTRENEMWCDCGNHSGESGYFSDGEHPDIHKHHFRCCDCEKITQIG